MASTMTPSKQVSLPGDHLSRCTSRRVALQLTNMTPLQAASAIENLQMETPVKKLNFTESDKENKPFDADLATLEAQMDAKHTEKTIMSKPTEVSQPSKEAEKTVAAVNPVEDEPLLRENPNRFVLFPIQYHEVCDASPTIFHA